MMKKSQAPFIKLSAGVDTGDLSGRGYTKMDVVNDVFIHSSSKPKYFVWDLGKEKRPKEANTEYSNDPTLNEEKKEDIFSDIECLEEVNDKDWRRWDTGKKSRKVKRSEGSFSELNSAVDIDDLPGGVYTKMAVINEVLKPPVNIVQPNPQRKYVAWDVDREERIKRADAADAKKIVFNHKDKQLNEKKTYDIMYVNIIAEIKSDTKGTHKAEVECTMNIKQKGKDSRHDYKKDNDCMATC